MSRGARLTIRPDQNPSVAAQRPGGGLVRNSSRIVRTLRLATGLVLFSFATCHLLNHSFGIRSTDAMQIGRAHV